MSDLEELKAQVESLAEVSDVHTKWFQQNTQTTVMLIDQIAALSQALLFLGTIIEDSAKLLPPGTLANILDVVEGRMDEGQRERAKMVLDNLAHWRTL